MLDVSSWRLMGSEPQGLTPHVWIEDDVGEPWLFKPAMVQRTGQMSTEHYSELVASRLARIVGVPSAEVELADRAGVMGCVSKDIKPRGWQLQSGALLLAARDSGFKARGHAAVGHSPSAIGQVLEGFEAPPEWDADLEGAYDVFCGYLILDALIANQDRHANNWAVLMAPSLTGGQRLAASFDHASSLGFNLTDQAKSQLLEGLGVERWASRGSARQFERGEDGRTASLVDLAASALGLASPAAGAHWRERVARLSTEQMEAATACPDVSHVTARFANEVITTNRRRLLNEGF